MIGVHRSPRLRDHARHLAFLERTAHTHVNGQTVRAWGDLFRQEVAANMPVYDPFTQSARFTGTQGLELLNPVITFVAGWLTLVMRMVMRAIGNTHTRPNMMLTFASSSSSITTKGRGAHSGQEFEIADGVVGSTTLASVYDAATGGFESRRRRSVRDIGTVPVYGTAPVFNVVGLGSMGDMPMDMHQPRPVMLASSHWTTVLVQAGGPDTLLRVYFKHHDPLRGEQRLMDPGSRTVRPLHARASL
jgi:hypothetical protein